MEQMNVYNNCSYTPVPPSSIYQHMLRIQHMEKFW